MKKIYKVGTFASTDQYLCGRHTAEMITMGKGLYGGAKVLETQEVEEYTDFAWNSCELCNRERIRNMTKEEFAEHKKYM